MTTPSTVITFLEGKIKEILRDHVVEMLGESFDPEDILNMTFKTDMDYLEVEIEIR